MENPEYTQALNDLTRLKEERTSLQSQLVELDRSIGRARVKLQATCDHPALYERVRLYEENHGNAFAYKVHTVFCGMCGLFFLSCLDPSRNSTYQALFPRIKPRETFAMSDDLP